MTRRLTGARTTARSSRSRTYRHQVLVLVSGGIDSATCLAFYKRKRVEVEALFVDYGQPAKRAERTAARSIAAHYKIPLHEVRVHGLPVKDEGYVPGRNAFLVASALAIGIVESGLIALGIHAGTNYPDCTPSFISACQKIADVYANGVIQVTAPFLEWSKGEVILQARKSRVPLRLTYSCERGRAKACGKCLSCQDLRGVHD